MNEALTLFDRIFFTVLFVGCSSGCIICFVGAVESLRVLITGSFGQ